MTADDKVGMRVDVAAIDVDDARLLDEELVDDGTGVVAVFGLATLYSASAKEMTAATVPVCIAASKVRPKRS